MSAPSLQDVICPICFSIFIEPVTMPCSHSLCMPCFEQHVAKTSLACPICRKRISVWVRRNAKSKTLINGKLWQTVQQNFAAKVEARLEGVEDSDEEYYEIPEPRLSAPGEIRLEYEELIKREVNEMTSRKSQEEEASKRLIMKMQEEEKMKLRQRKAQEESLCKEDEILAQQIKDAESIVLEKKLKEIQLLSEKDEEIAHQLEKEEKAKIKPSSKVIATPTRGPMDLYIGQKTPSSQGKLLLPEMSSASSYASGKEFMFQEANSSTLPGTSQLNRIGTFRRVGVPRVNSSSSSDSNSSRLCRQLREITASQSSESEAEDVSISLQLKQRQHANSFGKENVESTEAGQCSHAKSSSTKKSKKIKRSPSKVFSIEKAEMSEETDIEDDPDFVLKNSPLGTKFSDSESDDPSTKHNIESKSKIIKKKSPMPEQNEFYHNTSDICLAFDNEDLASLEMIREEQRRVEEILKQEEKDRLLAEALQKQMNEEERRVNRGAGSGNEYSLRTASRTAELSKAKPKCCGVTPPKRGRQMTLTESIAKRQRKS